MKDKKTVSLRLTQDAYDALQALARQNDRSVEGQLRALLLQHLRKSGALK
jgi:hypothetical protein